MGFHAPGTVPLRGSSVEEISLYVFVGNNPPGRTDAFGLRTKDWVSCGSKSLYITTDFCCGADVKAIHTAVCSAYKTLTAVNNALWNHENVRPWTADHQITNSRFNRFFNDKYSGRLLHSEVEKVRDVYVDLLDELDDSDGTHYQCDGKKGDCSKYAAYVWQPTGWTVHLCASFFGNAKSSCSTLIHELSHLYQQTDDIGGRYFSHLDKNGFPVYVDEKRRVVPFATYYRPKHADTLAAFALEWYVP
jgi:hypothetical protein